MMKISNIVVMGVVAMVLAWGTKSRTEHNAAARAIAVSVNQLSSQQAKVYDDCLDALSSKRLKNGGSNETFCGCFAGSAANDDNGIKYSAGILKQAIGTIDGSDSKDRVARMLAVNQDSRYFSAFVKTATAATECAKDQQHIFASNEERKSWCGAKPARWTDDRCRPLQAAGWQ